MQFLDIMYDLHNVDKIFYISGYSNPKLRIRAETNTKPLKVQMQLFSKCYPQIASHHKEHVVPVSLDKDGLQSGPFYVYTDVHQLFETEQESIDYYNASIDKVLDLINDKYKKVEKSKI